MTAAFFNFMEIEYEICEKQEEQIVSEACYGRCCTHGGYGNDEW